MKSYSLNVLIARNLFSLGFIVLCFYAILLVLSAYDLEDKIFISILNSEADKVALVDTVQAYNHTAPNQFTLYELHNLPEWASDEFSDEQRPIRELRNSKNNPVHGKRVQTHNNLNVVLIFETRDFVQATTHIINIVKFIVFGFVVLVVAGFYYCNKTAKYIAQPITDFSTFVTANTNLQVYNTQPTKVVITELNKLIVNYNQSIQQQIALLSREKQLNQDISHELRTPLTVIHGALEVLQDAKSNTHKQAAMERLFRLSHQMTDLVNGVLWLSKNVTSSETIHNKCDLERVLYQTKTTFIEDMGVPTRNITLLVNGPYQTQCPSEVVQVILRNLIVNAIAYSENNSVHIELNGRNIVVSNKISPLNDPKTSGFGIGLSIVKRLCEKFNILIDVKPIHYKAIIKLSFDYM